MKRLSTLILFTALSMTSIGSFATGISLNTSSTNNTNCITHNGTATVVATGGSGSYSYNWSTGSSTASATGLAPGSYSVTVNDAFDRTNITFATVVVAGAGIVMTHTITNVDCNNAQLGAITIANLTAASPYNVTWRGTGNFSGNTISLSNLKAGAYTVFITDANSCTASATYTVLNTGAITFTHTITPSTCANVIDGGFTLTNQSIAVNPVNYHWSGPHSARTTTTGSLSNIRPGIYSVSVSDANGCKGTSSYTVPLVGSCSINAWTGDVSTAWTTPGNWENGVPVPTDDIFVPSGAAKYPILTTATAISSVFVQAGGKLKVNAPLIVNGDWTNYGTAAIGTGSIVLQGTPVQPGSPRTIKGSTIFNNLEIAGDYAIGTTATDSVALTGILKKTSGNFTTADKLTLNSTTTQTALIQENGGTLTGKIIIERYIPAALGYRFIASGVVDATVGNWGANFTLFGTDGVGSFISGQGGTVEEYREYANTTSILDSGYYNYTATNNPLTSTKGFSCYIGPYAKTIRLSGTPATGTITTTITKTTGANAPRGWNLLGNPYPSPMSWNALKTLNPGSMNGTCYLWKSTGFSTGVWQAYNGTAGTNGVGDIIPSSGAFMVKSIMPASTIVYTDAIRTTDLTPVFYKNNTLENELRLTLSSTDATDEAVAYTQAGASDEFDTEVDAINPPMPTGIAGSTIGYLIKDNTYHIHVTDAFTSTTELPLALHFAMAGLYTISAASLNINMPVYLFDKVRNKYIDLSKENMTIVAQGNEEINSRYSVVFSKKSSTTERIATIYSTGSDLVINRANSEPPATVVVSNLLGQQVINTTMPNSTLTLPMEGTHSSIYLVTLKEVGKADLTQKVFIR